MSKYSEFFLLSSPKYCELNERLRLRSYKSWLAEEVWCREAQSKKKAKFTLEVIRLARKIAKAKDIDESEAFQLLQAGGEDREELLKEFGEEVNGIMDLAPSNREQFEELVTLFFRNRGEVMEGKKWTSTSDWSDERYRWGPLLRCHPRCRGNACGRNLPQDVGRERPERDGDDDPVGSADGSDSAQRQL